MNEVNVSSVKHKNLESVLIHAFEQNADGKSKCKQPIQGVVYNKNLNQKVYINLPYNTELYKDQIIQLHFQGNSRYAFIKEVQKHPVKQNIIHLDFFMPDESYTEIDAKLPINFIDQDKSEGLKRGGLLYIMSRSVPVRMKPEAIIPFLNVSLAGMNGGHNIRSANLQMPEGIENMRKDLTLATLIGSKTVSA